MKLVFEKIDGRIQVSMLSGTQQREFNYPDLINHLYLNRELEDSEFLGTDITQEEQVSVNAMVDDIRERVLNPNANEALTEEQGTIEYDDDIPF